MNTNRRAMISAGQQPRPTKLPSVVSDFCSVAVFRLSQVLAHPGISLTETFNCIRKVIQPFFAFFSLDFPARKGGGSGEVFEALSGAGGINARGAMR